MSYCRFGKGSDVYVFLHVSGFLQCCGCQRGRVAFRMGATIYSPYRDLMALMIARRHRVAFKNTMPRKKRIPQRFGSKQTRMQKMMEWRDGNPATRLIEQEAKRDGMRLKPVGYFVTASVDLATRSEMIEHLLQHREAGDDVPQYAIDRLQEEIEKVGDKV